MPIHASPSHIYQYMPSSHPPTGDTTNPLDDHQLLLGSMRVGLTRAEVRQAVRRGRDAGDLSWSGANDTAGT